jgi:molybdenum cofactor cytidylyltransferase
VISAIVLAAGGAHRFGTQKLLASIGGTSVVRWTVEHVLASRADEVVVVVGREGHAVRAALSGLAVRFAVNERWSDGMSTSLHAGLASLARSHTAAALIVLGDQPTIGPAIHDRLIGAFTGDQCSIVVPSYQGVRGNPVLFGAGLFPELLALRGDRGARAVVERDPARVRVVLFDQVMPNDVDTADDLEQIRRELDAET